MGSGCDKYGDPIGILITIYFNYAEAFRSILHIQPLGVTLHFTLFILHSTPRTHMILAVWAGGGLPDWYLLCRLIAAPDQVSTKYPAPPCDESNGSSNHFRDFPIVLGKRSILW